MDPAKGFLPFPMPGAAELSSASWRVSARPQGVPQARTEAWAYLHRLLLGPDDAAICRRCDECAVDRRAFDPGSVGKIGALRAAYAALRGLCLDGRGVYIYVWSGNLICQGRIRHA